MGLLDGKNAVITGSGRGLGRAYALAFTAAGAKVVVNDVDKEQAESVAAEIKAAGGAAVANGDSVFPYDSAGKIIQACVDSFGSIDILINNAGNLRDRTALNMTVEEFDDVTNVHIKGTFYCGQHAMRLMRDQGHGVILNVTSGAHHGNFGQTNYAGSKGAIASMTYTWALELPSRGIRVNCLAPAAQTRMSGSIPERPDRTGSGGPAINSADMAAQAAVFLASDEADWVHGQVFRMAGESIAIMEQPKYGLSMVMPGGWTVDKIREQFRQVFFGRLEPYGLGKSPYAWYEGVKAVEPPEKKR